MILVKSQMQCKMKCNYLPPTKEVAGKQCFQSCVCLPVSLSVYRGKREYLYRAGPQPFLYGAPASLCIDPAPLPPSAPLPPPDMFKHDVRTVVQRLINIRLECLLV